MHRKSTSWATGYSTGNLLDRLKSSHTHLDPSFVWIVTSMPTLVLISHVSYRNIRTACASKNHHYHTTPGQSRSCLLSKPSRSPQKIPHGTSWIVFKSSYTRTRLIPSLVWIGCHCLFCCCDVTYRDIRRPGCVSKTTT